MVHFECPNGHKDHGATTYVTGTHLQFHCYTCGCKLGEMERPKRGDIGIRGGPWDSQDRLLLDDERKSAHPSGSGDGNNLSGPIGIVATELGRLPKDVA